jgi:hypothetical protein
VSRYYSEASNVDDHIGAFARHSRYAVYELNTEWGLPRRLRQVRFDAIVLHYTVFAHAGEQYPFEPSFGPYLDASPESYKIAFFQDEYHWWRTRRRFIDEHGIDCVFTMLQSPHAERVFLERTKATKVVPHLPGYVGEHLVEAADEFRKPDAERTIDIGYRGRPMPPTLGRGSLEKVEVGRGFAMRAGDSGLALDIALGEGGRLYGDDYWRWLANCRGVLGVESGVSAFDLEDEILDEYNRLAAAGREPTLEELEQGALGRWDWKIPYRTISPRQFEAAALRVCQILFEGDYSGVMKPMRHYIPLKKDFSNLDQVLERFRDPDARRELTENAYTDLIASGEYGYDRFIDRFDQVLDEAGVREKAGPGDAPSAELALRRSWPRRAALSFYSTLAYHPLLSRALWKVSRPFLRGWRRLRGRQV